MKQTYPKKYITIIALNDGSTDNTYEKLKEWQKKFVGSFELYSTPNAGISAARNFLINKVTTSWFIWIDSDDYFENCALKCFVNSSSEGTCDLVIGKTYRQIGKKKVRWWLSNFMYKNPIEYSNNNLFFLWNKMYSTKFWKSLNFSWELGSDMLEDISLSAIILSKVKKIGVTKKYTFTWVQNNNSFSSVKKTVTDSKFTQVLKNFENFLLHGLLDRKFETLPKKEKLIFKNCIYDFLMQIFCSYVIFPAFYKFPINEQKKLSHLFYSQKRYEVIGLLNKYDIDFLSPPGWWRKFTYHVLNLKNRYNENKYKNKEIYI
jgi:glycosyltransferase involved in cell wall biosynthesis